MTMNEAIIATIITAVVSLAGTIITVLASSRQTIQTLDKKSELSDERIQGEINVIKSEIRTLSSRVEAHNQVIERTYKLEGRMTEAEHDIRDMKGRSAGQ